MRPETLIISYTDPYKHAENIYESGGDTVIVQEVKGDGDMLLEYGETWKIVIRFSGSLLYNSTTNSLKPNDQIVIEIKPQVGSELLVVRRLPPSFDPVMDLT